MKLFGSLGDLESLGGGRKWSPTAYIGEPALGVSQGDKSLCQGVVPTHPAHLGTYKLNQFIVLLLVCGSLILSLKSPSSWGLAFTASLSCFGGELMRGFFSSCHSHKEVNLNVHPKCAAGQVCCHPDLSWATSTRSRAHLVPSKLETEQGLAPL